MNKIRGTKGITLISLVITIIILLILAGITLNLILGNQGIFKKAKYAVEEYTKTELKTELEMAIVDIQAEKIGQGKEMTREDLQELSSIGAAIESTEIPALGAYKGYEFSIDENYIVTIGQRTQGEINQGRVYLYKRGKEYQNITGKFKFIYSSSASMTENTDHIYLYGASISGYRESGYGIFRTETMIDFSEYNKLYIIAKGETTQTSKTAGDYGLTKSNSAYRDMNSGDIKGTILETDEEVTYEIDVSKIDEEFYPFIRVTDGNSGTNAKVYIYEIWLEK